MPFSFRSGVLAGAALIAMPPPLCAQEAPADPLAADESSGEEIVVTGSRRRDEDAQEVPIALSIVSAEALERRGDYTLGQIQQQVPSLQVFSFNPRNTNINIRGLGSNVALTNDGLENGVGFYIDNVYYGRVGLSQFDLVDLEQIEVLRGPQGTLFGKNTTSGVINITSRKPSFDPEFSGEASIGNYSYYQFRASASGPLIADKLAIRLSGAITQNDGFLYNVTQRERAQDYSNKTIRGQLLFTPTEDVSLRLIGDFSSRTSRTVKKERARDTSPLESPRAGRSSPLFRPAHPAAPCYMHGAALSRQGWPMSFSRVISFLLIGALALSSVPVHAEAPRKPNFLIIVADDLGFSDLGAFGGEIDTPNLDEVAKQGLRLTGFHTAPTCSPTRAMLLSGTDAHSAGLGTMAELIAPNQRGKPGYEGVLKPNVATLAERLGSAGYRTILSGKWHLGLTPEQDPSQRGFEQSFTLLQGAHNHFGPGLSTDPAKGATYRENGKTLTALPADFYSSDYFATKLLGFLSESSGSKKPFFAYFAFSAPHWPLQAPASDIAKYKGRYDQGFEVLRAARLKRQAELGLIDPAKPPNPLILKNGGWNKLSVEEKAEQSRAMEVYAAMVDRLDRNVGRVIDYLKRTGQYENTVILFTADNGAEGLDVRNATMDSIKKIAAAADNRLENFGAATSYLSYGPGWAQAATAPSRLYKGYTTEGGTRAVAFITYPGAKRQGAVGTAFGTVQDVVPTFLDLAGVPAADQVAGRPVAPITGRSWAPYLSGTAQTVHGDTNAVSWELFGNRAVRRGDWKITDIGEGKWRLFNLKDDPGETNDLSIDQAERLKLLADAWEDYARRVGVILPSEVAYRP